MTGQLHDDRFASRLGFETSCANPAELFWHSVTLGLPTAGSDNRARAASRCAAVPTSRPAPGPMKISIITVCFNSAATIADALSSVDAQTWPDLEHWVIDGASRDATAAIVEAHPQPWRHLRSERDKGIYDAMNKGLALAQGEVIGLINSDDFYASPDAVAKVAAVFEDDSVDACYGDLCYVKQDRPDQVVRYWRSSPFRPGLFRTGWCPPHPTLFVRRRVYERFGGFDLGYRIAADMELMARLL